MSIGSLNVATIIVTYNRLELLKKSIDAHLLQTRASDIILIVDNSSTDGTSDYLKEIVNKYSNIKRLSLIDNTGGAGGFYYGLKYLQENFPVDWIWMMDDDAIPDIKALENLVKFVDSKNNLYGSLPQLDGKCCWPNSNVKGKILDNYNNFHAIEEVRWIPFLGFMISLDTVNKIGLPKKEFFLAADDVEYSMRAKKYGANIYIVRDSLLNHPVSNSYNVNIGYRYVTNLMLVPWKRYYDTRNRLLIAKEYYGFKYYTQTIPASFIRLFAALIKEENRLQQTKAFFAGFYDGIFNKTGKRHDKWSL